MEENLIQPTQKQSFKIPLIVLIVTFILNVILGYVSMANMTVEDFTNLMSVTPGGDR